MKLTKKHLLALLAVQSHSKECDAMADHISSLCDALGCTVERGTIGNLYVTKGKARTYPAIVAHMDTVHKIRPGELIPIEIGGRITGVNSLSMQQSGIGGDDKCGIWAALKCLESLPACKAAFFVDEEIGCVGSNNADMTFFSDCRFILQADRRGNSDFVHDISGPISSPAFRKSVRPFLKQYGFKFSHGAMTDVEALVNNHVGLSCANISAGYFNPHCPGEYIDISALENAIALMLAICHNLTKPFPHEPPPRKHYWDRLPSHYAKKTAARTAAENMAAAWADWETEPAQADDWRLSDDEKEAVYLDWYRSNRDMGHDTL